MRPSLEAGCLHQSLGRHQRDEEKIPILDLWNTPADLLMQAPLSGGTLNLGFSHRILCSGVNPAIANAAPMGSTFLTGPKQQNRPSILLYKRIL